MRPTDLKNIRVEVRHNPLICFDTETHRYHVWIERDDETGGYVLDDVLHRNMPLGYKPGWRENTHKALDFSAKTYAKVRAHILAAVDWPNIAERIEALRAEAEKADAAREQAAADAYAKRLRDRLKALAAVEYAQDHLMTSDALTTLSAWASPNLLRQLAMLQHDHD